MCGLSHRAALWERVGTPEECPRAAAIPERGTGRKAQFDPKDGISVITVSQGKLSKEVGK